MRDREDVIFRAKGLTKVYHRGTFEIHALRGVDFQASSGELVIILGPSGSGKSTFLNIVGGLDTATDGQAWFRDEELTALDASGLTQFRRDHVGFCLSVLQSGAKPYRARERSACHRNRPPPDVGGRRVGDGGVGRPARPFSGPVVGRRTATRRHRTRHRQEPRGAFVRRTRGALDSATGVQVLEALTQVNEAVGATTLIITHNAATQGIADRVSALCRRSDRRRDGEQHEEEAIGDIMVISPLRRKVLRDLLRLWAQVLAISLVLAAGVATMILGNGAYASLSETRARYYDANRFADVFADVTRAPNALMSEIEAIDGVLAAEARILKLGVLDMPGDGRAGSVMLVSLPLTADTGLNRLYLRQGRVPDPQSSDEVVVSEDFAKAHRLRPGSRLALVMNGQRRTLTVTGIALSPEFIYALGSGQMMPDPLRFGIAWLPWTSLEAAFDLEGAFSNVVLKLAPGASEDRVILELDRLTARYGGIGGTDASTRLRMPFSMPN